MDLKRITLLGIAICFAQICSKLDYTARYQVANFTLQALPYDYYALDPITWSGNLYYHHLKEHRYRIKELNNACASNSAYQNLYVTDLLINFGLNDQNLLDYAGGHYNHELFWWELIDPECAKSTPEGKLLEDIEAKWGTFTNFRAAFRDRAALLVGSGWVWLCKSKNSTLELVSSENDDSPLAGGEYYPLVGLDMWEHAYYLSYIYDKLN